MNGAFSQASLGAILAIVVALLAERPALAQFYPQPQAAGQAAANNSVDAPAMPSGLSEHARQMLEDAELCDVAFIDGQRGWAVGDRGAIWHTPDGGRTWQLQPSGVNWRLNSVHFVDPQNGWAVGGGVQRYTHRSVGVVLRTRDGGKRWTISPDATMPLLRRVKFVSPAYGWLVGEPSPLYPSGVFFTSDAGRSWQPVPGDAGGRWLCGDFRDEQGGAIAGREGAMFVATAKGITAANAPQLGLRAVRDVRFEARSGGVLVGDGGVVMLTSDAGQSWQPPRGALPPAVRREFDYRGAAVVGQRLWIVGAPGSQVLHSPDGGQTWQLQPTGQSLPLSAIKFIDAQHGWAVGALGTILATRDGGRTWLRQHSGGTRAALLVVLADADDLPLELIARFAGDEGYLTVAEALGRRDVDAPLDYAASASDRARAAMSSVGGSGVYSSWGFPLRESALPMSRARIVAAWDAQHQGQALTLVEEQLVRRIRMWQPDVIVAPCGSHSAARSEDLLLYEATRAAVAAAAKDDAYADQLSAAKLAPWQVKKVFTLAAAGEADDVTLATSRLAMRSGVSLADAAAQAQGWVAAELEARPATVGFRLATHNVAAEAARRDFFSGITLNAGGEARRRLSEAPAASVEFIRERAQRQRHIERLLAAGNAGAGSDAAWLAQIETLTSNLDRDGAARAVYQLAQRYEQSGRVALASDALQMLCEKFAEAAEGEAAQRQLFLSLVSAEKSLRQQSHEAGEVQPATAIGSIDRSPSDPSAASQGVVTTSGVAPVEKLVVQRSGRAVALSKSLERTRPALAMDPAWQLAQAAALRNVGDTRAAEAIYRRLGSGSDERPWAMCARAELWLEQRRGTCPKQLVRVKLGGERPYLDGKLDDAVWQAPQPLTLASRYGDDHAWPAVAMLAVDDEFLYLAATCRSAAQATPGERLELHLDVNRDWHSYFTLVAARDGETSADCFGDTSWQPTWYVAQSEEDAGWAMEAAIPLAELGVRSAAGSAWGIGLSRVVPGEGFQSWSQPAGVKPQPLGFGMLLIE